MSVYACLSVVCAPSLFFFLFLLLLFLARRGFPFQMKILSLISTLAGGDQKASEEVYEVLHDVMRRLDFSSALSGGSGGGVNAGYAIIYECVKTIASLYPYPSLLDIAGCNISRFISAENNNLRYIGITGLAAIVQVCTSTMEEKKETPKKEKNKENEKTTKKRSSQPLSIQGGHRETEIGK